MPRQKFGLQTTLGVRTNDNLLLAFRSGVELLLAGVAMGLAASVAITRLMPLIIRRFG